MQSRKATKKNRLLWLNEHKKRKTPLRSEKNKRSGIRKRSDKDDVTFILLKFKSARKHRIRGEFYKRKVTFN